MITATEVYRRWAEWYKKWQEAEARLIDPILDKVYELAVKEVVKTHYLSQQKKHGERVEARQK